MGVMDAPDLKSILTGKELSDALGVKPGVWMKKALDTVMEWQLRNSDEKDPQGAIDYVKARREELGIRLPEL